MDNKFSDYVVSPEDSARIHEWIQKHREEAHADMMVVGKNGKKFFHGGAIGGGLSFVFTPTSVGTCFRAQCHCGAELDLTDYNSW